MPRISMTTKRAEHAKEHVRPRVATHSVVRSADFGSPPADGLHLWDALPGLARTGCGSCHLLRRLHSNEHKCSMVAPRQHGILRRNPGNSTAACAARAAADGTGAGLRRRQSTKRTAWGEVRASRLLCARAISLRTEGWRHVLFHRATSDHMPGHVFALMPAWL